MLVLFFLKLNRLNSLYYRVIPTVFGTKPNLAKGHSAIALDDDRILVIKGDSTSDDCFWFLEVRSF